MRPDLGKFAPPFLVCLFFGCAYVSQAFGQTKQKEPLAVVAGQPIYDDDLLPFVQAQVVSASGARIRSEKQSS